MYIHITVQQSARRYLPRREHPRNERMLNQRKTPPMSQEGLQLGKEWMEATLSKLAQAKKYEVCYHKRVWHEKQKENNRSRSTAQCRNASKFAQCKSLHLFGASHERES